jgi:hypothetical protein
VPLKKSVRPPEKPFSTVSVMNGLMHRNKKVAETVAS